MKRALVIVTAGAVVAAVTGCGVARMQTAAQSQRIVIPADLPPSPTTWPKYPRFSERSCWTPPLDSHAILTRVAPNYAPPARAHPVPPAVVARRLLARFGDHRFVRAITFSPAPRTGRRYLGGHPPTGTLQARIVLRDGNYLRHPSPAWSLRQGIAQFEDEIVGGALRDDLCDAGGAPLVGNPSFALGQRYPNLSAKAFRRRVALIGRRFGFTVASLRLLRPRQIAPLLIVKTHRPRKAFIADVVRIEELLNPANYSRSRHQAADTFEALFFAAEDAKGPFVFHDGITRGGESGSEWVANGCPYPYTVHGDVGRVGPCT